MKIKEVGLSWVTVSDFARSKKFFSDLGLELCSDSESTWAEFKASSGVHFGISQENLQSCAGKAGTNAVIKLVVDDVVLMKHHLEARGVKFIGDIKEIPGHVRLAMFVDLDGNKFQLAEYL